MRTSSVAVMLTRRCNMACTHCSVESHPKLKLQPSDEEVRERVRAAVAAGVKAFQFTGGEPMLRQKLLLELLEIGREAGAACAVFTNGFWGRKPEMAEQTFDALRAAGMTRLALSYDRFHAEFQGPEPLLHILEVARRRDWPVRVTITRTADEHDLEELVRPFQGLSHAEVRFYDVQPVGAARQLKDRLRAELEGFCSACSQATLTDDGRVVACNGPAYFEEEGSPLRIGDLKASSLAELLEQHASDPVLETIRVEGPLRLKQILATLPGFEDFPFRSSYGGMCELCLQITRDPQACAALREHLGSDEQRALQVAHRRLRDEVQREATSGGGFNDFHGPKALMSALLGRASQQWARHIMRADLDWRRLAERLEQAGLLHLLARRRHDPYLQRWAPQFVWKQGEIAESTLQERCELLQQGLEAARLQGLEARPVGEAEILELGGERTPSVLELSSSSPRELESLLSACFGPEAPFRAVGPGDQRSSAERLLEAWRDRNFRDGMSAVWDAHELQRLGRWSLEPTMGAVAHAAARVLASDFGVGQGSPTEGLFCRGLTERIVRAQMFRDPRRCDSVFLAAALRILDVRQPREVPRAAVGAFTLWLRDLAEALRRQGFRVTWEQARRDVLMGVSLLRGRA